MTEIRRGPVTALKMNDTWIINPKEHGMTGDAELQTRFTYHPPKSGQPQRYEAIRGSAMELAELIDEECPESREKSLAMTNIEQAVMWANAAIARRE
jgi:hypothetical protein